MFTISDYCDYYYDEIEEDYKAYIEFYTECWNRVLNGEWFYPDDYDYDDYDDIEDYLGLVEEDIETTEVESAVFYCFNSQDKINYDDYDY